MESIEIRFTNLTFDELLWVRDFVQRNQAKFTTEVNFSSVSGTLLNVIPSSTIKLKAVSSEEETFKLLVELMNYLQTAAIKTAKTETPIT